MTGNELGTVGLLVVFPVLAAVIGAVLAAFRPPGARLTSGVSTSPPVRCSPRSHSMYYPA